jgi:hypothetical protein
MISRKFILDPGHWRLRAEEARTVADHMTHEEARTIMRHIANDYDRLAKLAEEQLVDQEKGTIGRKILETLFLLAAVLRSKALWRPYCRRVRESESAGWWANVRFALG